MPRKLTTSLSVKELADILMNSQNDVWRDDAAEELADVPDCRRAEEALMAAIESLKLDDSLRRTCAESLATIWIRAGHVPQESMKRLTGMPRSVVEDFLRDAGLVP
jgi:hypothetical protein